MARQACAKLKDLVIPNGTNVSNIWLAKEVYEDALSVLLTGESVTDAGITYTVEVTDDANPVAGSTWSTYQILNGAALANFVPTPTNGSGFNLPQGALASTGIRIKASGNVTADRTFGASKQYITD